jgi:hypothetical protein
MILMAVTLVVTAGAAEAEDGNASGRVSATYQGLVSAVTQERQFDVRVRQTDGQVVNAPVQIKGAEGFVGGDLGDVDWQVSGSSVTGTLTKNGQQVATFEGTADANGMSGTYRTRTGQTGAWKAPLPAATK